MLERTALRCSLLASVLFFLGPVHLWGQLISSPTLTTNFGNASPIIGCSSGTLEYTVRATTNDPNTVLNYRYVRNRSGSSTSYQLSGSLPPGVVSTYDPVQKIISIVGKPTTSVATDTVYSFNISSIGANCNTSIVSGTIRLFASPQITLITAASTSRQTGANSLCNGNAIIPIHYTTSNFTKIEAQGLPNGILISQNSDKLTLSGVLNTSFY